MNPFYSALNPQNPMQMLSELKKNPMQFLMQRKFNIPKDIASNPNDIVNHLVSSGQVSQEAYNRAVQTLQKMGVK